MAYRKDIKDGKVRYKYRYREYDPVKNKFVQRETTWCKTQKEAYIAYLEHIQGLEAKKSNLTLDVCLKEYLSALESNAKRVTNEKKSTDYTYFHNCHSLYHNYFYGPIRYLDMSEVQPRHFAQWLEYINSDTMGHPPLMSSRISAYKTQLLQFSSWLVLKGYIYDGFDISVSGLIAKVKTKKRKNSKRTDRNQPKIDDIYFICDYYKDTFYKFESCYWFTLFQVLFFTGMRVCELVALKWCNVDFDGGFDSYGVIEIRDSISEKEKREDVKRRHNSGNYLTKNSMSVRNITILEFYREYFRHYAFRYRVFYNVTVEEMSNMFVFPNITSRDDKTEYQDHGNILYQLNKVCSKCNLPKFDPQMFRHGFVYYLAYVVRVPIDNAYRLLGHTDSDMIKEVYLNMTAEETRNLVDHNIKNLISLDYDEESITYDEEKKDLVEYGESADTFDFDYLFELIHNYYCHMIEESIKNGSNHLYIDSFFDEYLSLPLHNEYDLTSFVFEKLDIY